MQSERVNLVYIPVQQYSVSPLTLTQKRLRAELTVLALTAGS